MKASRHYEDWPIEESVKFLNMYLDGVKNTDNKVLCSRIASSLGRTENAIKIRVKEVSRILGGDNEFPLVTPNMISAVDQIIESGKISANRMRLLF